MYTEYIFKLNLIYIRNTSSYLELINYCTNARFKTFTVLITKQKFLNFNKINNFLKKKPIILSSKIEIKLITIILMQLKIKL